MPDASDKKVVVLKGQEGMFAATAARGRCSTFWPVQPKTVNRPYGAGDGPCALSVWNGANDALADVCANLKGAITKPMTPKILAALADKGLLTQKAYGKTNIYLARQDELEDMPKEKLDQLTAELATLSDQVKARTAECKALTQEVGKLRGTPTDEGLLDAIAGANEQVDGYETRLATLRTGASPLSEEELAALDAEWARWRAEWMRRRKIFQTICYTLTEANTPSEAAELEEELGIERDGEAHVLLEKSGL
ncbi:TBPIP-domain-containing protein [Auricularia subglabra TFB-10046 SS5]|nr:TBPIP-domain-containing protein [Auricularia subglabra TFB-10046 SS5]